MLMDNTLELLGITDSNIKITRFSTESVNGEKHNVIEARLTYNVDRCPYCESEKVVKNGSKILHTRLTELHQERFEMKRHAHGTGGNHCDKHRRNLSLFAFKRHQNN